jgi:hypothetical protein
MHARSRPGAGHLLLRRCAPLLIGTLALLAPSLVSADVLCRDTATLSPGAGAALGDTPAGAWSWTTPSQWQTTSASVGVIVLAKAPADGAYAVGFQNTATSKTIRVRRVADTGKLVWSAALRGMIGKGAWANDAASDRWGNLYVAGGSVAVRGSVAMLAKFSAAGKLLWRRALPTIGGAGDEATAVVVDGAGNVFVTAVVRSRAKLADIVTAKFGPAGARLWTCAYATKLNDRPSDIALDSSGSVYVTGMVASSTSTTGSGLLLKIGRAGYGQWARTIVRPGTTTRVQGLFVVTRATSVWIAGQMGSNGRDVFVARYSPTGKTAYNTCRALAGEDTLKGFVVDAAGAAYLAGYHRTALTPKTGFLAKFTPTGARAWDTTFASAAAGGPSDAAYCALSLGTTGTLYAAGMYGVGRGQAQAVVARVSAADGSQTARWSMGGTAGVDAFGALLVVNPSIVYAAGGRSGAGLAYVQRLVP